MLRWLRDSNQAVTSKSIEKFFEAASSRLPWSYLTGLTLNYRATLRDKLKLLKFDQQTQITVINSFFQSQYPLLIIKSDSVVRMKSLVVDFLDQLQKKDGNYVFVSADVTLTHTQHFLDVFNAEKELEFIIIDEADKLIIPNNMTLDEIISALIKS